MHCPTCSRDNPEVARFCAYCGGALSSGPATPPGRPEAPAPGPPYRHAAPPADGMAVGALVLGLLGLVTCGITALIALPMGIASLVRINREPQRFGGQGLAIGAIVVSGSLALCFPIFAAIVLPVFSQARTQAATTSCLSNSKQIALGYLMYTQDYDERTPAGSTWTDCLLPYTKNTSIFVCPAAREQPFGYAMNARVSRITMASVVSPGGCVQIFDALGGGANRSGQAEMVAWRHRPDKAVFSYMDGHARSLPRTHAPNFDPKRPFGY